MEIDQQMNERNIQQQSQANAQAQQVAAQAEVQKQQALTQSKIEVEKAKGELEKQKQQHEAELKEKLMRLEFELNMQLKDKELEGARMQETIKEDRKDTRQAQNASQQSELIDQKNSGTPPKKFESSGNDEMGGMPGIGL